LNSTAGFGTFLILFIIYFGIIGLVGKHSLDKYGTVNLPQVTIKQSKKSKIKGHKVFDLQRFGNSP